MEDEDVLKLLIDDNISDFDVDEDIERELLKEDDNDSVQNKDKLGDNPLVSKDTKDEVHGKGEKLSTDLKDETTKKPKWNRNDNRRNHPRGINNRGRNHNQIQNSRNNRNHFASERRTLISDGPNAFNSNMHFNNNYNNFMPGPRLPSFVPPMQPINDNNFTNFSNQNRPPYQPNNFPSQNYNLLPMNLQMNSSLNLNSLKQPLLAAYPSQLNHVQPSYQHQPLYQHQPSYQHQPDNFLNQNNRSQLSSFSNFPVLPNTPMQFNNGPLLPNPIQPQQNKLPLLNPNFMQSSMNLPPSLFGSHNQQLTTNYAIQPVFDQSSNINIVPNFQLQSDFINRNDNNLWNGKNNLPSQVPTLSKPFMAPRKTLLPGRNNVPNKTQTDFGSNNSRNNQGVMVLGSNGKFSQNIDKTSNGKSPGKTNSIKAPTKNNVNRQTGNSPSQSTVKTSSQGSINSEKPAEIEQIKEQFGIDEEYMKKMHEIEQYRDQLLKIKAQKRKITSAIYNNLPTTSIVACSTSTTVSTVQPKITTPSSSTTSVAKIVQSIKKDPTATRPGLPLDTRPVLFVNHVCVSPLKPEVPTLKVKITGLNPNTRESAIRKICRPFGMLKSIAFITEPSGTRFAIVHFEQIAESQKFVESCQNQEIDSCFIKLSFTNWFVFSHNLLQYFLYSIYHLRVSCKVSLFLNQ